MDAICLCVICCELLFFAYFPLYVVMRHVVGYTRKCTLWMKLKLLQSKIAWNKFEKKHHWGEDSCATLC
jgi:hypothetical protein